MRICPGCGESCAHAWCGFCERVLDPVLFPRIEDDSKALPRVEPAEVATALGATPVTGRGCAFGECTDPDCWICVRMAQAFHVTPCGRPVEWVGQGKTRKRAPCRLVHGHRGPCQPSKAHAVVEDAREDSWWT